MNSKNEEASSRPLSSNKVWPVPAAFQSIYSHAVESRPGLRMVHVSGQVGVAPDGTTESGFRAQCERAIANVEGLLAAAGMTPRDIVKTNYYLIRPEDLPALNDIRQQRLPDVQPAVTTLIVSALVNPEWLIEMEVVAAAP